MELVSCGKPNCTRCAEGPAHGPYWYRYYRRNGKVVSKYVGKQLPAEVADRRGAESERIADKVERALAAAGPLAGKPADYRTATAEEVRDHVDRLQRAGVSVTYDDAGRPGVLSPVTPATVEDRVRRP